MNQLPRTFVRSSIGKKLIMAITGLGALGFVGAHLFGNLYLFGGSKAFNSYAHHLHAFPLLDVLRMGLLLVFALHILFAVVITINNRQSRRIPYAVKSSAGASNLASSTMIYSGLAVLVFLFFHMMSVKAEAAHLDAYDRVVKVLGHPYGAATYLLGVLALGLHLFHGAGSTLQSLGIKPDKYARLITIVGRAVAVALAVGFASIPVYVWFVLSKGSVR